MMVNGSWECLGGPGPVIFPMRSHSTPMQPVTVG
jgi:hypothetical protein